MSDAAYFLRQRPPPTAHHTAKRGGLGFFVFLRLRPGGDFGNPDIYNARRGSGQG